MKVAVSDNLGKTLKSTGGTVGQVKIPIVGLQMGLPIGFEAKAGEVSSVFDEGEIIAQGEALLDLLFPKLAQQLEAALTAALKAPVWAWNSGARDIFDTGELARSGRVEVTSDGVKVVYTAPYANLVHNGGYIQPYGNQSARPIYLPGRPWVSSVLYGGGPVPQFDFDAFFSSYA